MLTNSIWGDIKYYLRHGNMVTRLILVNTGIFIVFGIFYLFSFFGQSYSWYQFILQKLELPASFHELGIQPWSALAYMFLHVAPFHILFNMLWLWWFGEIFVLYLGDKRVLPLYILGGLAGAATYILAFNFLPVFKPMVNASWLLGASASILAIATGAATINPEHEIGLMFIGPVRIKYIIIFSLLLDAITIPYTNAGGYISHMGGAFSGFLYIKLLQSGYDIFSPFNRAADSAQNVLRRRSSVKVAYKNERSGNAASKNRGADEQERVDEILDKIARSGYDSLTKEEKDFLFNYSRK